jgi:ATPase subunit of ABC transporter with duplicated ATPase domains
LFSGDAGLKKTETLSGGEAARLLLAKLILLKNNVVVLDEPTNHLDVESIDALLQALVHFEGTVIVTSHDRHFVGKLATRVLALTPKGPRHMNGTYDEYLERYGAESLER